MADGRRAGEDRRPGPQGIGRRRCALLPRSLCSAGLAHEARGLDRQSRLLPLSPSIWAGVGGLHGPPAFFLATVCSSKPMASIAESLCFTDAPPIAAEVARGVTRLFCRQDL